MTRRLGVRIDGIAGKIGPDGPRLGSLFGLTLSVLAKEETTLKELQILGDHWTHVLQFRREASSLLEKLWGHMTGWKSPIGRKRLPQSVREELIMCLTIAPLLVMDLRGDVSSVVICSDACESGCGVMRSKTLTEYGRKQLLRDVDTSSWEGDGEIGLISLFDGIAGARQALHYLGVGVGLFAASKIDKAAMRIVRTAWPGVKDLGDGTTIDGAMLRQLSKDAPRLRLIFLAAGSPCQDLSGLNRQAPGDGGSRAQLAYQIPRVAAHVSAAFPHCIVKRLVENVASMEAHVAGSRLFVFNLLGLAPVRIDADDCIPVRRRRFYWLDWDLPPWQDLELEKTDDYLKAHLTGTWPKEAEWLSAGAVRLADGNSPHYILVRACRRRKPGMAPVGLEHCDESTRTRWIQDHHRYPPYQYRAANLIEDKQGLPPLSSTEREVRMGFPRGYTSHAIGKKDRQLGAAELEDLECSLIGNSFSVPVIARLMAVPLFRYGPLERRRTIGECWGQLGAERADAVMKDFHLNGSDGQYRMNLEAVRHLFRNAVFRCSDVRFATATLRDPRGWPRLGIGARR